MSLVIRPVLKILTIALTAGPATTYAQAIDTARLRAGYAAATAMRNDLEKSHGRFVTVNGVRMHYLEWGDRKGVPLVWAHGSGSFGYEIRALAPRLVEAGYRVLAVDYRGHGLTRVTDFNFGTYQIADDLIGLLDSLRISRAVFGGASLGAFVDAQVYDHYPNRVLGLLMADGGTWSPQWIYDRQTDEQTRRQLPDPLPPITGATEFDVFRQVVGNIPPGDLPVEWLFDMLNRIGRTPNGEWSFLPEFDRMMASGDRLLTGITHPTTLPPLIWSVHCTIPRMVFRNLRVPMVILDPQDERDTFPVTDQNEMLAKDHPDYVIHRVYAQSKHNILQSRPDWFVRDAATLLELVRKQRK